MSIQEDEAWGSPKVGRGPSAIVQATDRLEAVIQQLSTTAGELAQRLHSVLRENVPQLADQRTAERIPDDNDGVPHADQIHGSRRILESINAGLMDVLNRLEV